MAREEKTCSCSDYIHLEMCTNVRTNKAQFPEKNNHIFRNFGILDAIYLSSKGFVSKNLDHGHRLVRSRFSCNRKRRLGGEVKSHTSPQQWRHSFN